MIGVVAHERGQIEGDGEAGLALREQITKALIGVFGGAEAGELAHGPEAAAIHGGMNAAGVRRLARVAEIFLGRPIREIGGSVEALDRIVGDGGELFRALRRLFESWLKNFLFPFEFGGRGFATRFGLRAGCHRRDAIFLGHRSSASRERCSGPECHCRSIARPGKGEWLMGSGSVPITRLLDRFVELRLSIDPAGQFPSGP